MVEVEAVGSSMEEQSSTSAPPPPPSTRRPRVREVSSRFMSPVSSSSSFSAGDLHLIASKSPLSKPYQQQQQQQHRSTSTQRQRRLLETDSDENRPTETTRSLESPFQVHPPTPSVPCTQRKHQHHRDRGNSVNMSKLLRENGSNGRSYHKDNFTPSRPDTPMLGHSRVRPNHRSTPNNISAAAKLLQSSGIGMSVSSKKNHDADDNSSQISSSDSEADCLPTVSTRLFPERNSINRISSKYFASPLSQSLSSPLTSCEPSFSHTIKSSQLKHLSTSLRNNVSLSLPPVPPSAKVPTDTKKGRKGSSHQEDIHSLKLLYNRYLQWRYANVKAHAAMEVQKSEVGRTLYSFGLTLSDLNDSVRKKRMELGLLRRMKTVSTITEAQMPYLETWSILEEDYSISLSEALQALLDASRRLPISGDVRADPTEIEDALKSATKLMDTIMLNIQSFMPKAEEVESLISELARVSAGERVQIGECGDLMSKTCNMQVEESSLRAQLIQFCHLSKFEEKIR